MNIELIKHIQNHFIKNINNEHIIIYQEYPTFSNGLMLQSCSIKINNILIYFRVKFLYCNNGELLITSINFRKNYHNSGIYQNYCNNDLKLKIINNFNNCLNNYNKRYKKFFYKGHKIIKSLKLENIVLKTIKNSKSIKFIEYFGRLYRVYKDNNNNNKFYFKKNKIKKYLQSL